MPGAAAFGVEQPIADLGHEAVVGAEVVGEVLVLAEEVPGLGRVLRPELGGVAGELSPVPFRSEVRAFGRLRPRVEELPGDRVLRRRTPLEVGAGHPVRAAAIAVVDIPAGIEEADERLGEVVADAGHRDQRLEVLVGEARALGPRQDDRATAVVLADQHGVLGRGGAAGGAQAVRRGGEGPRVDRLDGRRQQVDALEEERSLLLEEQSEPFVGRDLPGVRLDLREVGVHRRVDDRRGIRNPLGIDAAVELGAPPGERAAEAVLWFCRLVRRDVRSDDVMRAGREPGETDQRAGVADEAVGVARQARGEHLVAEVARPVAVEQDPPLRRIGVGVAQRRERDADLQHPAGGGDLRRAVPEVVGGVVLARGVVGERVVLDAAGVGEEHLRRMPVVLRVDDHPAVVGVGAHVVAVAQRRADRLRIGLVELEGSVEELVVVGEPGDAPHFRRNVVAGVGLQPVGDRLRRLPDRIGEVAIDHHRRRRARDVDLRPHGGEGAAGRQQQGEEQQGEKAGAASGRGALKVHAA